MRCPKCGYISYDNVSSCLKCGKDISQASSAFQGSTQNVAVPSFLKFEPSEADQQLEGAAEVGEEIEFADPDLEILVDEEEDEDGIDFSMEEDEGGEEDDLALAEEFGEMESFSDDEDDEEELDLSADLGQFEDVAEDEDSFGFEDDEEEDTAEAAAAMEIPDELADISDLSPPESASVPPEIEEEPEPEPAAAAVMDAEMEAEPEPPPAAAEPEDDLDFSSLDMDLDLDGDEETLQEEPSSPAKKAKSSQSDMDEELNFDLDLGGLSIHDDLK